MLGSGTAEHAEEGDISFKARSLSSDDAVDAGAEKEPTAELMEDVIPSHTTNPCNPRVIGTGHQELEDSVVQNEPESLPSPPSAPLPSISNFAMSDTQSSPSRSDPPSHDLSRTTSTVLPKRRKKLIVSDDDDDYDGAAAAPMEMDQDGDKASRKVQESDQDSGDDDRKTGNTRRMSPLHFRKDSQENQSIYAWTGQHEDQTLDKDRTTAKTESRRSRLLKLAKARATKLVASQSETQEDDGAEEVEGKKKSKIPAATEAAKSHLADLALRLNISRPDPKISALMKEYMTEDELAKARDEEEEERRQLAEKYKDDKMLGIMTMKITGNLFSSDDDEKSTDEIPNADEKEAENLNKIEDSNSSSGDENSSDEGESLKKVKKDKKAKSLKEHKTLKKKGASKKELLEMQKEKERLLRGYLKPTTFELPSRKSTLSINDILAQYGLQRPDGRETLPKVTFQETGERPGDEVAEPSVQVSEADGMPQDQDLVQVTTEKIMGSMEPDATLEVQATSVLVQDKASALPLTLDSFATEVNEKPDRKISKVEAAIMEEENRRIIRRLMETGGHRRAGKGKASGDDAPAYEEDDDIEIVDVDESSGTGKSVVPASVMLMQLPAKAAWNQQLRRLAEEQNKARREKELAEAERAAEEKKKRKEMKKAMREKLAEEEKGKEGQEGPIKDPKESQAEELVGIENKLELPGLENAYEEDTRMEGVEDIEATLENELVKSRRQRSPSEEINTKENITDGSFKPPTSLGRLLSSPRIPFEELPIDTIPDPRPPPTPRASEDSPLINQPPLDLPPTAEPLMGLPRKREDDDSGRRVRARTEENEVGECGIALDEDGFAILPEISESQQDTTLATQDSLFTSTPAIFSSNTSIFAPSSAKIPASIALQKKSEPKKFGALDAFFKKAESKAKSQKPSIINQMKSKVTGLGELNTSDSQDILGLLSGQFEAAAGPETQEIVEEEKDSEPEDEEEEQPAYRRVIDESEDEADVELSGSSDSESSDASDPDDDDEEAGASEGLFAKLRQIMSNQNPVSTVNGATMQLDDVDDDDDGPVMWKKKVNAPKEKRKKLPKSAFVEMEAEEEEDEFMGMGGPDDDYNSEDEDDEELICSGDEDVIEDFTDVVELHRQRELDDDTKRVESLLNDVTSGNLRRRLAGKEEASKGFTLSDSDDEEDLLRSIRKGWMSYRHDDDPNKAPIERMAGQNETAAFARCFSSLVEDENSGLISDEEEEVSFSTVCATLSKQGSNLMRTISKTSVTGSGSRRNSSSSLSLGDSLTSMGMRQTSVTKVTKAIALTEEPEETLAMEETLTIEQRTEATRLMKRVKPAIPFRSNTAQKPLQPLNTSGPGLRGVSRISRTLSSLRTSPGKQKDLKAKLNALEASNARSHGGGVSERTSASVVGGGGGGSRKSKGGFLVGEAAMKAHALKMNGTNVAGKVGGMGGDGGKGNGSSSSKLEAVKNVNVTSRVSKKQGSAGSGLLRMLSRQESFKAMD